VKINVSELKDEVFKKDILAKAYKIVEATKKAEDKILAIVESKL
jgi:formiminotetrahydrofolate cyclodeaminase